MKKIKKNISREKLYISLFLWWNLNETYLNILKTRFETKDGLCKMLLRM